MMKKTYFSLALAAAALLAAGCAKELDENAPKQGKDGGAESGYVVLGASLPDTDDPQPEDTKTTISDNGDKTYSVFWSADDAVSVNGMTSTKISISPENPKNATFTLPAVDAPYCAVYPAGAYIDGTYSAGTDTLNIQVPSEQKYVKDGIDPASAIMVAYSTDASGLKFRHAMAYLKLTVTGADVKSVRINGNYNDAVSGEFTAKRSDNGGTLTFAPKKDEKGKAKGNTSIKYSGETAIPAGTPMFIAIPAAMYSKGLTLTIVDNEGHCQVIKSTSEFMASSGKVYPTSVNFDSQEIYVEGGIYTVEDWNSFIASVNDGTWADSKWNCEVDGKKGTHLMADIYSATNLQRTSDKLTTDKTTKCEWNGTFYGHNHTLTHNGYEHLFTHVGTEGKIQDLKVAGERTSNANNNWVGSIALVNEGTIENCENLMNITLSDSNTNAAGICRTNKGTVTGCRNSGTITITSPSSPVNVAGIALANTGTIKGCTNSGAIIVGDKGALEGNGIDQDCIVAGVVQRASGTVEGLANTADITINAELTATRMVYLGGVIANAETTENDPDFLKTSVGVAKLIKSCSNSGALRIIKKGKYHMKGGSIGGIAASVNSGTTTADCAIFDSCTNTGDIEFYETETYLNASGIPVGAYAVGGILGRCAVLGDSYYYKMGVGTYTVIRVNCVNKGNIDVCVANGQPMKDANSGARQTYVGGVAGFVGGGIVRGNKDNSEQITVKLGSLYGGICAGGILGGAYGTAITGGPMNSNVKYEVSDNAFAAPAKIGYVGAVLGWAASDVTLGGITAAAEFDLGDTSDNLKYGFAGVKTGATLKVQKGVKYNGGDVAETNIYGGGTKSVNQ